MGVPLLRVYLIRHGETEYNRTMKVQGHAEIPLNDLGIAQAARLARRFSGVRLDRIYASDLRRATMTAAILAAHTGAPLLYDPGLRERDPGDLTHKDYQESLRFFTDPAYEPPAGETHHAFLARVKKTFEALIEREVARELWEQGSSGVHGEKKQASPAEEKQAPPPDSEDFTEKETSGKAGPSQASPPLLDPGLQDTPKARDPREEFNPPPPAPPATPPAGPESRPVQSSKETASKPSPRLLDPSLEDVSDARRPGERVERDAEWDALSPVHVPAAPGIDLDAVPHLALVTHGMVCRAFVELFAPDAPPPGLRWLNTSLSILDYMPKEQKWHVHVLADAGHLNDSIEPGERVI